MNQYLEFTLAEVQELLARKERRLSIAQTDVALRVQVQHLRTVVAMRMLDRDLLADLEALRKEQAKGAA